MAHIETVSGPIAPQDLGLTLSHEHVLVDFAGADVTGPHRWDRAQVVARMLPYLREAQGYGVRALVECTPAYLGRDVRVLAHLSEASGLHLITNTGLYREPHIPADAFALTPEELAARWIAEWTDGIDGTAVRPGLIKIAVNPGALLPIQRKIVRAAALTHLATGLTIACHTNDAVSAHEALDIVEAAGMDPARYIVVHAHNMPGASEQDALAARGCWLSYDNVGGGGTLDTYLNLVTRALEQGRESRVLISHDAGWYHVGEPDGGAIRPFTAIFSELLPALRARGVDAGLEETLLVQNPARALTIGC